MISKAQSVLSPSGSVLAFSLCPKVQRLQIEFPRFYRLARILAAEGSSLLPGSFSVAQQLPCSPEQTAPLQLPVLHR